MVAIFTTFCFSSANCFIKCLAFLKISSLSARSMCFDIVHISWVKSNLTTGFQDKLLLCGTIWVGDSFRLVPITHTLAVQNMEVNSASILPCCEEECHYSL